MDSPQPFRRALPWVGFVTLLFLLSYCGRGALSPLFPYLERDLDVGHTQATSLLFLQGAGLSISLCLGGLVLSRITSRTVAGLSLCLSGACFLLIPLCETLGQARVAFFAFGLSAGLYFPAGMTTLRTLVGYKDWGKAVAIHELAPNLGFILFPLIAQVLLLLTDWRGVIGIWGFLMILTGLAFFLFGRGGREYAERVSLRGGLALARHPSLWICMYLLVVALVGEYAVYSILPLHLVHSFAMQPDTANYLLSLSRLAAPVMVLLGGWAVDEFSVRRFLVFSLGAHTLGLLLLGLPSFSLVVTGMIVQSSAIALTYPGLFKLLGECYPGGKQPLVLALCMPASGLIGSGVAPALFGLAGETLGFGWGMMLFAAFSVICLPLLFLVRRFQED